MSVRAKQVLVKASGPRRMMTPRPCGAFGNPDHFSYIAGGVKTIMDAHYIQDVHKGLKGLKGKPYAFFYTNGGGCRIRDSLSIFKRLWTLVGKPVESYGRPTPDVLDRCRTLGRELATTVLGGISSAER